MLTRWKGTALPYVFNQSLFWSMFSLEVALLLVDGLLIQFTGTGLPVLDWKAALVPSSLLTFFIVFYTGNCYSRYFQLWGHCVGMGGAVMEWTTQVKAQFGGAATAEWNAVRYMIAAVVIEYSTQRGGGVSDKEWLSMESHQLLTHDEIETLQGYTGFKPLLAISWGMSVVRHKIHSGRGRPIAAEERMTRVEAEFQRTAFAVRGHCGQIRNLVAQPIPLPYFHILTVMLVVVLSITGYSLLGLLEGLAFAEGATAHLMRYIFTMAIYAVFLFVYIALREIAIAMSDPFGDDDLDFDTNTIVGAMYDNSLALLKDTTDIASSWDQQPPEWSALMARGRYGKKMSQRGSICERQSGWTPGMWEPLGDEEA